MGDRLASLVALVVTAGVVPAGAATAGSPIGCDVSDDLVASVVTDYSVHGRFAVHITPTDEARSRGPVDFATGSTAVTDDVWQAVLSCTRGVHGSVAESLHQQLECHVWLGVAAGATGPTYDLESWRRPLAHPGLASYVRTRCLNVDPAVDSVRGDRAGSRWRVLWSAVDIVLARWSAAGAL